MGGPLSKNFTKTCLCLARVFGNPAPKTCVETGTYQGDSALRMAAVFAKVHTIELSEKWHQFAKHRLADQPNIICHQGDSGVVIGSLLATVNEPVMLFLDAHWAGGDTAYGPDEVPLLRELEFVKSRAYNDIVIIDDLRLIAKASESGGDGQSQYLRATFDWRTVTLDKIAALTGRGVHNVWMYWRDRIIIFRNQSVFQGLPLMLIAVTVSSIYRCLRFVRTILRKPS